MSVPRAVQKIRRRIKLQKQAYTTSLLSNFERRIAVKYTIREALGENLMSEEEVFKAAYGDKNGVKYWEGWFANDFLPLYQFVDFIETHSAKSYDIQYITRSPVLEALSIAERANPTWIKFVGEDPDGQKLGTQSHPQLLSGWEVQRRDALKWLVSHPDFSSTVPASVRIAFRNIILREGNQGAESDDHISNARLSSSRDACLSAIAALFPGGVPKRGTLTNKTLVGQISDHLQAENSEVKPSPDTILRAAGRKTQPNNRGNRGKP